MSFLYAILAIWSAGKVVPILSEWLRNTIVHQYNTCIALKVDLICKKGLTKSKNTPKFGAGAIFKKEPFSPVSGVIGKAWPYTSKFSLAFLVKNYLLGTQTVSLLCIFIFYVVKFCGMTSQSYYITIHKKWKLVYLDLSWFLML